MNGKLCDLVRFEIDDRHMHLWLVRFLYPSTTLWTRLYEEFL